MGREEEIAKMHLEKNKTTTEIGEILGFTPNSINRAISRYFKMRKKGLFKKDGLFKLKGRNSEEW